MNLATIQIASHLSSLVFSSCSSNTNSENVQNDLTRTTGTKDVPAIKVNLGYHYVKDKFGVSALTALPSDLVKPPCIQECPVQMEAELTDAHEMMKELPDRAGAIIALEVKILRVHVDEDLRLAGHQNRIDAHKWRPMIMSFQDMYGLANRKAVPSRLARIKEEIYRVLTRSDVKRQGGDMDLVATSETNGDETQEDLERTGRTEITVKA